MPLRESTGTLNLRIDSVRRLPTARVIPVVAAMFNDEPNPSAAKGGAAPLRWTVSRLLSLILSPSILHPKRSLPPQAAEALSGFFLRFAENRLCIKLQERRSQSTPGVGIPGNPILRRLRIPDHAASLAA